MFGLRAAGRVRCLLLARRPSPDLRASRPAAALRTPLQQRAALQYGSPFGRPNYYNGPRPSRHQRVQGLKELWSQSPGFRYSVIGASGLGGAFYVYNLEEVPVSGRRRFNVISADSEAQMAMQMYQQTLQEYSGRVLSRWHPSSKMVQRVLDRLIPQSGVQDSAWEVHVIDDPAQKNAFVMPGGKVFVFSGILPICDGDDGLAAVLGHEIAHNVAHHAAERMSQTLLIAAILYPLAYLLGAPDFVSQVVLDYGFVRPGSRKQEAEADYIGLLMMAQSCYDPSAAVGLWQRMEQAEKFAPPQWLSTHPSSHNRVEKIQEWLPKAQAALEQMTSGYADSFKQAVTSQRLW